MCIGGSPRASNLHATIDKVCLETIPHAHNRESYNTGQIGKMGIMLSIQIGHPTIMTTDTNTEASNFLLSLLLLATPILYKPDSLDTAMSHRCFENCQSQL